MFAWARRKKERKKKKKAKGQKNSGRGERGSVSKLIVFPCKRKPGCSCWLTVYQTI